MIDYPPDIPPDMYERMLAFAESIVGASNSDDVVMRDAHIAALEAYYEDQTESGRIHPFLTEVVADFTLDAAKSVPLYELALQQSRKFPQEPTHTKMIALAQRLFDLGLDERAEAYLRDARTEAVRRDEEFWVEYADTMVGPSGKGH